MIHLSDKYYTRADFSCKQSGICCRLLNLEDLLQPGDVKRWRRQKRNDILQFVKVKKQNGRIKKAWFIDPHTNCPFSIIIKRKAWCIIYDTRPLKCKQWPFTAYTAVDSGNPARIDSHWFDSNYPECTCFEKKE